MGAFQAMVPLAASPTYGFIYKRTVESFPGVFLLFSAGLYFVMMTLLFAVNTGMRRSGVMDGEKEYTPENMEKLIEKRKESTRLGAETNSKIIVEMAPEGQRFKEVAVSVERKY